VNSRYVCIALIIICYIYPIFALHSAWGTTFSIRRFSLGCFENFMQVHSRDDRESISLLFCLGIVKPLSLRTSLLLPTCFLYTFVFPLLFFKKKKNWRRRCRIFFFFYSLSDIVCVFAWYLCSLCINWICLYMIESLCLISAKFSCAS
jgi:hypothetical protein